jgi:hypothetical protein
VKWRKTREAGIGDVGMLIYLDVLRDFKKLLSLFFIPNAGHTIMETLHHLVSTTEQQTGHYQGWI